MQKATLIVLFGLAITGGFSEKIKKSKKEYQPIPCTCGIFLSGQLKKGTRDAPKTEPVLTQVLENVFPNNMMGQRQCATKCIEAIIKYLPKSSELICATLDRDCAKEKALLFTKNYNSNWINSNMSAGREYCCKDNLPYKCPLI